MLNTFDQHPRDIDTEQWQKQIDEYVSESTTPEDLKEKISEYYSKLTEKQSDFVQFYRKQCTSWIKGVASDEEKAELKALYATKDGDVLAGKINDYVNRLSENERAPVLLWKNACAYLWNIDIPTENIAPARVRRSTTSHNILSTEWLTSEQISQLSGLENDEYDKKYLQFFKDLTGETKHSATKNIVKKCYGWLEKVATQEERDELKDLHHKDHSKCKEKVQEYLGRLPEEEKAHIKEHLDVCEEIWYAEHGHGHDHSKHHQHRRRRNHEHSFEDFAKEHLTWLSDEQKAEAMKIKDDKVALKAKMKEFFEATIGEKRQEATQSMKGACRKLMKHVLGDEKSAELKAMKESGSTPEALKTKLEEFLNGITDEHLKEEANEHKEECMKFMMTPDRKRRDHHHGHKLEDYLKTHLSWLTTEQGETLKQMKADGKTPSELQKKVFEYYEATTGETREKATELLKGGCRDLIKSVVGEEKAEELKKLKESGASDSEMSDKIKSYIAEVVDPQKKELAVSYEGACKKVFGVASRKRRHEGKHGIDDFVDNHLSWLNAEQKTEIDKLKVEGNFAGIKSRVNTFFESATGETKQKATEELKGACRELYQDVLGDKANEVKALKESGASDSEIAKKIDELIGGVTDEAKKAKAEEYKADCKKIFGVESRKKRDHHHGHKLEDYLKTHLSWLTTEQGETLKQMKADGKTPSELQKKVFEYYEATTGETREKATELLKGGCRDLIKSVVGDEKAEELKKLKESGASDSEMSDKIKSYIAEVVDPQKKELAVSYEGACKKVFGVASRKRRDHHHGHKLEDYLKTHLSWLTTEQGETLKQMKADNKSPEEMQKKVFEFYEATTGETRVKATELLQGGCRDLIKSIVGDEKAQELKNMRESGASVADLNAKVKEFMGQIEDEEKKQLASKYEGACKKIFGVQSSRKRRDHHHDDDEDLEKFAKNHLTWLTDEQKQELQPGKQKLKQLLNFKMLAQN
uniref:Polyprotein allergen nematode domain-containing protein n=1 Tax=Panagrolaimus davidi TaxID=227884 RepID=A0A914QWE5_9BILA